MPRILVVEDDPDIRELLDAFLTDAGHTVAAAGDGLEGVSMFALKSYDLVLLDIMMPKLDGYGACELIRKTSDVPIIMLTALDDEVNQIRGYDLRIDDYITKPFSVRLLIRKVEAVLRRYAGVPASAGEGRTLRYATLTLDLDAYTARLEGEAVELTKREFELMAELIGNRGKVLTRQMLLDRLWQMDFYGDDRVVDTHIKNLRKKLRADYIQTIRGVGYRID